MATLLNRIIVLKHKLLFCYVMFCYVLLCSVLLCYVMLCYVMLCHVMLCHVMLCYVNAYSEQNQANNKSTGYVRWDDFVPRLKVRLEF